MTEPHDTEPWWTPRAAYVHIPFCGHHCGYCDFAVTAGQDHLMTKYVEALTLELTTTLQQPTPVSTVFIGGGTPTYLPDVLFAQLLEALARWLPLTPGGEWSVEATPESITPTKVALLADYGVTRVSLGVQTFHEHLLPRLDRQHSPTHTQQALAWLRPAIPAVSLDLIFGIPGQTLAEWDADLRTACAENIPHLSTYGLTYEKGTPLWKQRERGTVLAQPEEMELAFYEHTLDALPAYGLAHYEISNFARPGWECRHNEIYWANHAYFGFGVGAARYVQGRRELNRRNTTDYIRSLFAGDSPTLQSETLPPPEKARETGAVQLRRTKGILRDEFCRQTGQTLDETLCADWQVYVAEALLADDGRSLALTRRGKCVADALVTKLFWT